MQRLAITVIACFLQSMLVGCDSKKSDSSAGSESTANPELTDESIGAMESPIVTQSSFDDGIADGWTITSVESANVSIDGVCGLVQVEPSSGFLCADASEEGGTSYFVAPEKFLGDLNVYSSLNFRLVADGGNYYDSGFGFVGDISISNGVSTASYTFSDEERPMMMWRNYEIPLIDNGDWIVDDGSALPTVLQSVIDLRIRAEYGVGMDSSGLDDVFLK